VAQVIATGPRTKFGRTAELIRTAYVISTQQKVVFRVVRNLALFNGVIIVLLVSYAIAHAMPFLEMIPLILTAILTSIQSPYQQHSLSQQLLVLGIGKGGSTSNPSFCS